MNKKADFPSWLEGDKAFYMAPNLYVPLIKKRKIEVKEKKNTLSIFPKKQLFYVGISMKMENVSQTSSEDRNRRRFLVLPHQLLRLLSLEFLRIPA